MRHESGSRFRSIDEFAREVESTAARLDALRGAADPPAEPALADVAPSDPRVATAELETMLEELSVASEELRHQQDELVAARESIEEERLRYRDLFDFAPDAYLVTDVNGNVREANRAACAMLGVSEHHIAGKPLAAFVDQADRRAFRTLLSDLPARRYSGERPILVRPRGAPPIPAGVTAAASGETGEVRWLLRDISERVHAQERLEALNAQLERRVADRTAALRDALAAEREARERAVEDDKLKARLLGLLSHEIRTPLQTLVGTAELLERELHGPLTAAQRADVARMQRSQEHMLAVLDSVLEWVRLRHGTVELERVPVAVGEMVQSIVQMLHPQLAERDIALDVSHVDPACTALADPHRLRQVILNLVTNAIKFSEPGGTIAIVSECVERRVALHVVDHGKGIPADRLEAIFEPFVQLSPERGGSGLGLAISRDLVRAMGGTLSAESEPGKGSVFTIALRR